MLISKCSRSILVLSKSGLYHMMRVFGASKRKLREAGQRTYFYEQHIGEHTHTHARVHTPTHTHTHTHTHTQTHTHTHTYIHTH
jgi:hypothetical protein